MHNANQDFRELKEIFRKFTIGKEELIELTGLLRDEKYELFERQERFKEKIARILKELDIKISEDGVKYILGSFGIASEIYTQEIKNNTQLREILEKFDKIGCLSIKNRQDVRDGFTLNDVFEKENYLYLALTIKILSEILDLPLKGKSLEEYKNEILKTCKEIIKEEKEKKNES